MFEELLQKHVLPSRIAQKERDEGPITLLI
jgi:hypothetical protein